MALNITEIFNTYGTSRIAKAMGLPISTVHSWKRKGALPGGNAKEGLRGLHDLRAQAFKAAVKSLKKKRRAA